MGMGLQSVGGVWLPPEQMLSLPHVDAVVVITSSLFIFKATLLPPLLPTLPDQSHLQKIMEFFRLSKEKV